MKRTSPPLSGLAPSILSSRGFGTVPNVGLACYQVSSYSTHQNTGRGNRQTADRDGGWAEKFSVGQHYGARRVPGRSVTPTCRCNFAPTGAHPAVRPSTSRPMTSHASRPGTYLTHRLFHTSRRLLFRQTDALASDQTHYETLNVPADASTTEIKKSFYKLSKQHHPDHNPKDPHAPRRFMRISEAYSVLSQADKRAVYDRDVMRHHSRSGHYHPHHSHTHRPNASYHSTGPAGGRPASGLSRRRTQFRGPPPSFFRNTGSGRGAAYTPGGTSGSGDGGSGGPTKQQQQQYEQQYGYGPGNVNSNDKGTRCEPNTPHFDRESNERTHRILTERAADRRASAAAIRRLLAKIKALFVGNVGDVGNDGNVYNVYNGNLPTRALSI
ncbi:hypothetical protein F503_01092 [Ophiostoma piceae UAMH 11346]|uniref:J domain-containing protein n=1 Tax=Ophiostoma piceae (strain UAMH 11346) TaxID=1262450 RepID=S3C481_OPHP1|nr:hypothetical protein F503_01092 [Ophiostoma piceae UAMH 11346]